MLSDVSGPGVLGPFFVDSPFIFFWVPYFRAPVESVVGCFEASVVGRCPSPWQGPQQVWPSSLASLTAPLRCFLKLWRPRVTTFSVSTARFSKLKLLGDKRSSQLVGVSLTPCKLGFRSVALAEPPSTGVSLECSPPWKYYWSPLLRSSPMFLIFSLFINIYPTSNGGIIRSTNQSPHTS